MPGEPKAEKAPEPSSQGRKPTPTPQTRAKAQPVARPDPSTNGGRAKVPVSPLARRIASERGIDVTGVAGSYWHDLSVGQAVLLGTLFVAALVLLVRRGWLKLFGPVLYYDLVRVSRRTQYIWLRFAYAALLTLVLC